MPLLLVLRRYAAILTALLLFGTPLPAGTTSPAGPNLQPFVMPSSSMAPTLLVGDRFYVDMTSPASPQRGDLVLIQVRQERWLQRIAAIPGDRIAMRGGMVVLNGQQIPQKANGNFEIAGEYGQASTRARKLRERFPGEGVPHSILDLGSRPHDDLVEKALGPGQYFLLGDNRDNSMDSRMPKSEGGIGLVKREQILGRPLYRYWRRGEGWKRVNF